MTWVQGFAVVALALAAPAFVLSRHPLCPAIVLGIYGLLFAVLFLAFQAPDVALSQLVISTVGLPLMILLAIAKIRQHERERDSDE